MGFVNDYLYSRAIRTNPAFAAQQAAREEAELAEQQRVQQAEQVGSLWEQYEGAPATPAEMQETPYQMSPDEMMEGEAPIQGLMDEELIPGQPATGLHSLNPADRQRAAFAMAYQAPDEERVKQFAGHSEGLFENATPEDITDFMRKQQWFQENPEAYERFAAAGRSPGDTINVGMGGSLTPLQEWRDKTYGKNNLNFEQDQADLARQIAQLTSVSKALGSGDDSITGPIVGTIVTEDTVGPLLAPKATAMKERVEEVVQRSLRLILGAQFTEREGFRLIARAYNPRLSEKENKIRVDALIQQLQYSLDAKQNMEAYAQEHGTLRGYRGAVPSIDDFHKIYDRMDKEEKKGEKSEPPETLQSAAKREQERRKRFATGEEAP